MAGFTLHMAKAIAALIALAAVTGCGKQTDESVPVSGRVLLDGKPLTTGTVITTPESGPGARGQIDRDGWFTLATGDLGQGASVGVHRVAVVAVEETKDFSPEAPRKLLVPQRYTNPTTSHLEIDVQPGQANEVVLELSSKPQ